MRADGLLAAPDSTSQDGSDRISMYRLRSESSDEAGETWDLRWEAVDPPDRSAIVRRTSRARFQQMDATGLLDSDVRISGSSIASLLGE